MEDKAGRSAADLLTLSGVVRFPRTAFPALALASSRYTRIQSQPAGGPAGAGSESIALVEHPRWAARNNVTLELGWKVEVAKSVKQRTLDGAVLWRAANADLMCILLQKLDRFF